MKGNKIGAITGFAIVVANMIGSGAFTSLGFQLNELNNPVAILTLWVLGGILALAGAFSYAEVGTTINKSGGEYSFLSQLYHPIIGYLSGWISLTVGFAAPIALSAIAFVDYFPFMNMNSKWMGIALILFITIIHMQNLKTSSRFQNIFTILKIILITGFIVIGLFLSGDSGNTFTLGQSYFSEISSMPFAVGLIYVSYSYSGWNAAAYITEEFEKPKKALPFALIGGTLLVTVLYSLLQFVFLKHVSSDELAGQVNVGAIAANAMLGKSIGRFFSLAISLLLISSISAMVWIGPRVTSCIAQKYYMWRFFQPSRNGIPKRALWLQFLISTILIVSGTFEQIMIYCGVLLTISTMLVVYGVFILRIKGKEIDMKGYRSPLFPLFQIIYLLLSFWMILFTIIEAPKETAIGMINLLIGLCSYFLSKKKDMLYS
ncbi:MAG: amino acid permease [Bacteroides sp.]|jgi:APA family basic amino acid/polyamine antiporter|nr:amino acid permease [Bacteroides sp.]MCI1682992.1 amino acid permease [Bacteroides sp.]